MNLFKKESKEQSRKFDEEPKEWKDPTPYDLKDYDICWKNICPYGRFKGLSLLEIKRNEKGYFNFIEGKRLLYDWGFLEPKIKQPISRITGLWVEEQKCWWIGLKEYKLI